MNNWENKAVSYYEDISMGIRTFYDKNEEIVYCEPIIIDRDEILINLKELK